MTTISNQPRFERKREEVYKAAEELVKLGSSPSPGCATWHEAMERAYNNLIECVTKGV